LGSSPFDLLVESWDRKLHKAFLDDDFKYFEASNDKEAKI
jgi:hypothetical protein